MLLINKALYNKKTKIGFSRGENWLESKIDNNSENLVETFTLNDFVFDNKINLFWLRVSVKTNINLMISTL